MPTASLGTNGTYSNTLWLYSAYGNTQPHQVLASNEPTYDVMYDLDAAGRGTSCSHPSLPGTASGINSCYDYAYANLNGTMYIHDGVNYIYKTGAGYQWQSASRDASHLTVALVNSDALTFLLYRGGSTTECSYYYRYCDYSEGGMYFIPIWSLVPLLFGGAGLIFREFLELVKESEKWMNCRKIVRKPLEIKRAWQEYKNGLVIPRYFVMGS